MKFPATEFCYLDGIPRYTRFLIAKFRKNYTEFCDKLRWNSVPRNFTEHPSYRVISYFIYDWNFRILTNLTFMWSFSYFFFSSNPASFGGNISLTCSYTGDPTPTLAWIQGHRSTYNIHIYVYVSWPAAILGILLLH